MAHYAWLVAAGAALGTIGTLIGAGGGFVLMPALLLAYPQASPETITSISLAVVFCNALSGSCAYARMKRIDYRTGLLLAAATVPGAILGAVTTNYIPRRLFDAVFGLLMLAAAAWLFFHRNARGTAVRRTDRRLTSRTIVEASGAVHHFSYDLRLGMWLSLVVGYVSSVLGIGGGIIHVPALISLLDFPVHIATATSHFILAIMALTGTIVHIATGSFAHGGVHRTLGLGLGVLIGAQAGAWISARVHGIWIVRGLAVALAFVGIRILLLTFGTMHPIA